MGTGAWTYTAPRGGRLISIYRAGSILRVTLDRPLQVESWPWHIMDSAETKTEWAAGGAENP